MYADEYDVRRTNGNIYEQKDVKIADVAPLKPENGKAQKMYKKVFLAFAKLVVLLKNCTHGNCTSSVNVAITVSMKTGK